MTKQSLIAVDRAKQNISDLDREIRKYLQSNPCRVLVERDVDSERLVKPLVAVFRSTDENFDGTMKVLIRDAFVSLRVALDSSLASKVAEQRGDISGVHFPIIDRPGDAQSAIAAASIQRAGPNVVRYIDELQAYSRGNGEVFHALIRVAVNLNGRVEAAFLNYIVTLPGLYRSHKSRLPQIVGQPCHQGAKVVSPLSEEHYKINQDIEAEIEIALSGGGPFERIPVLEALTQSATAVSRFMDTLRDL